MTAWGTASALAIASAVAHAQVITGIVMDPQALPIYRTNVVSRCGETVSTGSTSSKGTFTLEGRASGPCTLTVSVPGFVPSVLEIEGTGHYEIRLAVAPAPRQKITVRSAEPVSTLPFGFGSRLFLAGELTRFSPDASDWIGFAKRLSGSGSSKQILYVDGIPADQMPPKEMISGVSINSDPFSVEYQEGDANLINVITKKANRQTRINLNGTPFGNSARNGLDRQARSESSSATGRVSGPIGRLPIAYFLRGAMIATEEEVPVVAALPRGGGGNAIVGSRMVSGSGYLQFSGDETFRGQVSWNLSQVTSRNAGAGGITLAESSSDSDRTSHEMNLSLFKTYPTGEARGGASISGSSADVQANSSSPGIVILGNVIAGGPAILGSEGNERRWNARVIYQNTAGRRSWLTGVAASSSRENRRSVPNSRGTFQFETEDEYLQALEGRTSGVWFGLAGNGAVHSRTLAGAPFVQANLVTRENLVIRGGVRADYQERFGTMLSPRLSLVTQRNGFVFRSGVGQFVREISNGILVKVIEGDENHLRQLIQRNVSLWDTEFGSAREEAGVHTRIGSKVARARMWTTKNSIEKSFHGITSGIEYTWNRERNLLGSRRLPEGTNWVDLLESNRSAKIRRLQARGSYSWKGHSLSGNYELSDAMNDTDGPFSFPGGAGSIRDEWARSPGVPRHSASFVTMFQAPAGITLTTTGNWNGATPFNITSGLDPAGNGQYTDRGGRSRNSGNGPGYRSVSLYGHKRLAIPQLFLRSKNPVFVHLGFQAENVLGFQNITSLGSVANSATFGRPLAAMPERSVRVTFNFE